MPKKEIVQSVHGMPMTVRDAAARLNIPRCNLYRYLANYGGLRRGYKSLQDAFDYYAMRDKSGDRRRGRVAKKYRVNGKAMTIAEAAEKVGVKVGTFYALMSNRAFTPQEAYDYYARKKGGKMDGRK